MFELVEFSIILNWIKDDELRKIVEKELKLLPSYFWKVPASSTGKYHPEYCLGEGGLVRHVKAACKIAHELFEVSGFNDEDKDVIIAALLLHDGFKHGRREQGEGHTVHEHPVLMSDYLVEKYWFGAEKENKNRMMTKVSDAIASHMGKWIFSEYSPVTLPEPETPVQVFVHMCDYLASRKSIEVNLEDV